MTDTKRCSKCGKEKPLDEFHRNKRSKSKDGLSYYCAECDRKAHRAAYRRRREAFRQKRRARYARKKRGAGCTCHDYAHCMMCRNAEKRAAFAEGRVPAYLLTLPAFAPQAHV